MDGSGQTFPEPGASAKPKLLDRVRLAIRTRHYSLRTERAYVHWIRKFILFNGKRHPREMGEAEITRFLTWLAVNARVSSSTQNQALSALLFLHREVLGEDIGSLDGLVWAKKPKRLPVVLSREEVKVLLSHLQGIYWLMANLMYGAGLRLRECLQLRVKDTDFSYQQITVRSAKGDKDRLTVLPQNVQKPLKEHLARVRKIHEKDLATGFGSVYLPYALEKKYPNAATDLGWQWVFPASSI